MLARPPINWQRVDWLTPRSMHDWPLILDFDAPEQFAPWRKRIE
jgi:hypothetical protein